MARQPQQGRGFGIGRFRIGGAQQAQQPAQGAQAPAPAPFGPDLERAVNNVLDGFLTAIGYVAQSGQNVSALAQGAYGAVNLGKQTSFTPNAQLMISGNTRIGYEHAPMPISTTEGEYNPQAWKAAAGASNQADKASLAAIVKERAEITGAVKANFDVDALRALGAQQALEAVVENFQIIGRLGRMSLTFNPAELLGQLQKYVSVVQVLAEAGTGTPDYAVRDSLQAVVQGNNVLATATNPVVVQLGRLTQERAAALTLAQYAIR